VLPDWLDLRRVVEIPWAWLKPRRQCDEDASPHVVIEVMTWPMGTRLGGRKSCRSI
jgi:hypothetical protein